MSNLPSGNRDANTDAAQNNPEDPRPEDDRQAQKVSSISWTFLHVAKHEQLYTKLHLQYGTAQVYAITS